MQVIQINERAFKELLDSIHNLHRDVQDLKRSLDKEPVKSTKYLSVKESAKFLNKSEPTIRRIIAAREIPFIRNGKKIILFKVSDLIDYLESKRVKSISELKSDAAEYFRK
jgi:excisionase family DNA binding protein